ncbi:DinB family protein [bacterium]|nr:DinB family protein [bacterium]
MTEIEKISWQYSMTWKLAEYTLEGITQEMSTWEPSKNSWNIRKNSNNVWRPDFSETEPTPIPTVTIAWLLWHVHWWWGNALLVINHENDISYQDCPVNENVGKSLAKIKKLNNQWTDYLGEIRQSDLAMPISYPWKTQEKPLSMLLLWVNSELMKNIAEIGYIKHLYENEYGK